MALDEPVFRFFLTLAMGRKVEVDGIHYDLGPGDAATFPGDLPHRICNLGRGELVAISSIAPPSF